MNTIARYLLVLGLLAGCRSERVALRFQSEAPVAMGSEVIIHPQQDSISVVETNVGTPQPQRGDARMLPLASGIWLGLSKYKRQKILTLYRHNGAEAAASIPHYAVEKKTDELVLYTLMTVAGVVLMVGAVVLGVFIGGWTGFGVGLVLFLVGAFLNLLGIFFNGDLP